MSSRACPQGPSWSAATTTAVPLPSTAP
jgi:hypothetical protein